MVIIRCDLFYPKINLIAADEFQTTIDGKSVDLFTLKNDNGIVCQITNYGGRLVSLYVPDKFGSYEDVVLGYANLDLYTDITNKNYFGATVGRYANRIANARFLIDGKEYILEANNGENHLHGGGLGFSQVVWDAKQLDQNTLDLYYKSANGEEGYPGNVSINVRYTLTDESALKIEYKATTDQTTPINLTHHSYFNLKGGGSGDIYNHALQINASNYTPIVEGMIPTGEILPVAGTPFDFRNEKLMGKNIDENHLQLVLGKGYDHNFVLDGQGLRKVVNVKEYITGRTMEVWTNEPGLQFYSGNFLNGLDVGKQDKRYHRRGAFCLETQHFPDSPNQEQFPSTLLEPNETYTSICIYKFGVIKE